MSSCWPAPCSIEFSKPVDHYLVVCNGRRSCEVPTSLPTSRVILLISYGRHDYGIHYELQLFLSMATDGNQNDLKKDNFAGIMDTTRKIIGRNIPNIYQRSSQMHAHFRIYVLHYARNCCGD